VSIIAARGLSRSYGQRRGICGVDLEIAPGSIFGFLGPNGAGKTTTIRVLLGFLRPGGGQAHVFGLDCWRKSHLIKRHVGYLPGDLRLYPWWTARSALRMASRIRGQDLMMAGHALAERLALPLDVRVLQMSRGMRQKLGLLIALVHAPRLLVLDEPTSGLDPPMRFEVAACLRELATRGSTVFFSSHTLSEVEQLCDDIAIVREGEIAAHETLESLRNRASRIVTLRFPPGHAAANAAAPEFLQLVERRDSVWYARLEGPTPPLVEWAAQQPIQDLSISPPDLESLFRTFYGKEAK
jgi:ABC-2 type transport system ATP-binding protein